MKAGTESKLNATEADELANIEYPGKYKNGMNYSEGESPTPGTGQFHVPFSRLPSAEQNERILWLWRTAYKKAVGAAIIIRKQVYQNNRIYLDGYSEPANLNYTK